MVGYCYMLQMSCQVRMERVGNPSEHLQGSLWFAKSESSDNIKISSDFQAAEMCG